MDDPRANMQGNKLLDLGAPTADWSKTPGRVPGFWLAVAAVILAVAFPVGATIAAVLGLSFTMQAYRQIPSGAHGRRLTVTALVLAGAALLLVAFRVGVSVFG